ncbi:MAG: thioredoxin fold domain-containing protein [Candidatus Aminicenantes bacterium]|nr:thioredoxin fold domain-containing protein [Candidatus Aminicenantes bacterium]NIM80824.1 thioredoxin fold domain-containing protein [Candidatus Aminicenantes bacterium]NIN20208.1 thioredoxin fold domain-containing protein [Candidatus Aminicenantes bacterium]NIN43987.1 thioredoxin fold domain-containing protein [Candidatus Aminicenantes bacterium]NIN86796.1 thioredoxin fold domain-containing protein [Candidatus Aminicenantes bacterium]
MNELILANDANFDALLEDRKAIIVDFWSPTCAPCITIEPALKKIAVDYRAKVKVLKVNVNDSPRTSSRYLVRGLPTLLFIKNGSVKTQMVGTVDVKQIEQTLRRVI